jgi:hypothetical protein
MACSDSCGLTLRIALANPSASTVLRLLAFREGLAHIPTWFIGIVRTRSRKGYSHGVGGKSLVALSARDGTSAPTDKPRLPVPSPLQLAVIAAVSATPPEHWWWAGCGVSANDTVPQSHGLPITPHSYIGLYSHDSLTTCRCASIHDGDWSQPQCHLLQRMGTSGQASPRL